MSVRNVFVPIMGWRENTARVTGIERLWREARALSGPSTWVLAPLVWHASPRDLAALIVRNADPSARIVIVGHSWGIGWGAVRLAWELAGWDRDVAEIVSADGVYRSRLLPWWLPLNPISVGRVLRPRIPVPSNVWSVQAFVQRRSVPYGHGFRAFPGTAVRVRVVDAPHCQVDDLPEFREAALAALRGGSDRTPGS